MRRTTGQHPGGMVVIPQDREIYDFCPVQHPADDPGSDIITTHFDYHKMEDNLLKLDMLGHDDPTMIRMMEDLTGVNAREIPLDDQDTMTIFTNSAPLGFENDPVLGPTGAVAVPEFNTKFTRQMLLRHPAQAVQYAGPSVRLLPRHGRVVGQRTRPHRLRHCHR